MRASLLSYSSPSQPYLLPIPFIRHTFSIYNTPIIHGQWGEPKLHPPPYHIHHRCKTLSILLFLRSRFCLLSSTRPSRSHASDPIFPSVRAFLLPPALCAFISRCFVTDSLHLCTLSSCITPHHHTHPSTTPVPHRTEQYHCVGQG